MLIKLSDSYMVNTDDIIDLNLDEGYDMASVEINCIGDRGRRWEFWYDSSEKEETIKLAKEKYKEISEILEKAVNLKVDKNGAFLCSHCGAPNGS